MIHWWFIRQRGERQEGEAGLMNIWGTEIGTGSWQGDARISLYDAKLGTSPRGSCGITSGDRCRLRFVKLTASVSEWGSNQGTSTCALGAEVIVGRWVEWCSCISRLGESLLRGVLPPRPLPSSQPGCLSGQRGSCVCCLWSPGWGGHPTTGWGQSAGPALL